MKRLLLTGFILLSWNFVFGQTESEILSAARDLIENRKYDSAFNLLNQADPQNENPAIVLLKEDIALNYFAKSLMHQMFGIADLSADEDIYDVRSKEGISSMYSFPVNDILEELIKKYPENYKLHKGLADYYYDVHLKYGDNWIKSNDELFDLIQKNYNLAISHNESDYLSYYVLGYIALVEEKYYECIPLFIKSISLNENYATSYYNLAYAYLNINERENALQNAIKSLELYTDQTYKGDAARMVATIYSELGNEPKMIEYYELSNEIDPGNYYTLGPLLNYYVKTGSDKMISATSCFYDLAPDNPTIYNDLSKIYFENNKSDQLAQFYISKLDKYQQEPMVYGNLNFYLGRIFRETNKKLAAEYFLKAKDAFAKVFEKDHQVFSIIDEALKELE